MFTNNAIDNHGKFSSMSRSLHNACIAGGVAMGHGRSSPKEPFIRSIGRTLLSLLLAAAVSFVPSVSTCADADSFRTPEYMRISGFAAKSALDWINANEAYALGYTGAGVRLAIMDDSAFPGHREFLGKDYLIEWGNFVFPSGEIYTHGIHVSGIAAANKDDLGMHGVAFAANLLTVLMPLGAGIDPDKKFLPEQILSLLEHKDVKIANNSWGKSTAYCIGTLVIRLNKGEDENTIFTEFIKDNYYNYLPISTVITQNDVLFVFAAGNDGYPSPSSPANYPSIIKGAQISGKKDPDEDDYYTPLSPLSKFESRLSISELQSLSLDMISVSSFDPYSGKTTSLSFISPFSNLAEGASDYTLLAPGSWVYSTGNQSDTYYFDSSGTSMATPFVTGVAGLVSEAFPFLGGKQIADILLSTATPITNMPHFLLRTMPPAAKNGNVIIPQSSMASFESPADMLRAYYNASETNKNELERLFKIIQPYVQDLDGKDFNYFYNTFLLGEEFGEEGIFVPGLMDVDDSPSSDKKIHIISDETYARLFGMGIVNAGRAVLGPGWLDAHRIRNEDGQTYDGQSYAMYPVDTKGYNALWSNNIQEMKIGDTVYPGYDFGPDYIDPDMAAEFYGALTGLPVGLLKKGGGTLTLSGDNGYKGATVVEGGEVALGTTGQSDRAAKLAGDVIIGRDGAFSGNGEVKGALRFAGTVSPGLRSNPGSVLRVNGNVVGEVAGTSPDSESLAGKGTLFLNVWADGRANILSAGGNVNLADAQVAISGMSGGAMPAASFLLAQADEDKTVTRPANEAASSKQGVTLLHEYRFALSPDGSGLVANHAGATVLPETKALSEGRLAGLTLLDIGADLVAGQGIDAAKDSLWIDGDAGRGEGMRLNSFAALSVGSSRYETGSHVDVRSMSLMAGLAIGSDIPLGRLVLGAFFEFGEGAYDTYNSFPGRTSVSGAGNANHLGGGVLGSLEFLRLGPGLPHVEASARAGRLRNGYSSSDLVDFEGESAEYDADTPYFGWHVGAGYAWDICDDFSLDLYGRYLSTRQYGKSITLSTGDPIKFEDAVSSRLRLGGRLAWEGGEVARPYVGLAWDREFDGRQRASTNGFDLDVPSTKGDTGVGEIGLAMRPSAKRPLTVDLALQGYAGVRRGISGSLQVMLEF